MGVGLLWLVVQVHSLSVQGYDDDPSHIFFRLNDYPNGELTVDVSDDLISSVTSGMISSCGQGASMDFCGNSAVFTGACPVTCAAFHANVPEDPGQGRSLKGDPFATPCCMPEDCKVCRMTAY